MCARGSAFQQQPQAVKVEEQKPGRVKHCRGFNTEQTGIERRRALEIAGVLGNLDEPHRSAFRTLVWPSILLNQGGGDKGWQGKALAGRFEGSDGTGYGCGLLGSKP
jgi:hypothetical protein